MSVAVEMRWVFERVRGDRWRCHVRGCRNEVGVRKGTWLESSNLPFRKVVLFLYCWSRELTSIEFSKREFSKRELGISRKTVVDWNNFLRGVCANDLLANPQSDRRRSRNGCRS